MITKSKPYIQVYCPELQDMISPGEWTSCPFFEGKKLEITDSEDVLQQIFRCHVKCGCKIEYQYYEGDKLVAKVEDSVEDKDSLRRILQKVDKKMEGSRSKKPKRVFLVDDDTDFLEMHSAVLQNRGYEVFTAQSSKDALEKLDEVQPDIVVLDVMMEKFDSGFKASEIIKKKYKNLPVMLLTSIGAQTGLEFSSNEEVLKVSGADILLDKPVSPKIFIDAIERLTSEKKS